MSTSTPPDLRVLLRKLNDIAEPQLLLHALPSLINHVLHCKEALSAPSDSKVKNGSSEAAGIVHKIKLKINNLLTGRTTRESRFVAVALIKTMVDVGGWEVLRDCQKWVAGLLAVVEKSDPMASKELAIVTLARIYISVQPYQTLVREIATPTIPTFVTACLKLISVPKSGEKLQTPLSVIETICDTLSALIPLYPTTVRPSSAKLKTAVKPYLAPTQSDEIVAPQGLQRASRKLVISLHHVAAKSGGSDEWAKLIDVLLKELHSTADQVLRAVQESWEGSNGYTRSQVEVDGEPNGGGGAELPSWSGIEAGAERLVGLYQYLSDCLKYPTKTPVTIPTSALVDAASRLLLIARLSPKSQTWDQALQTNAAISRDEKDNLWAALPDIHISALQLIEVLFQRLGQESVAIAPEVLDHLVRVFKSGINLPTVRTTGYTVLKEILTISGPTLSKSSVASLDPILGACCRDLQQDAGHLKEIAKPAASGTDSKKSIAANADLFLKPQSAEVVSNTSLEPKHKAAATSLLPVILSNLPQRHLKAALRGLVDQTAIVTSNRDAMLASVLNPYKDQRGRVYPSILPHLTQQFPDDKGLEILRTNICAGVQSLAEAEGEEPLEALPVEEEEEEEEDEEMKDGDVQDEIIPEKKGDLFKPGTLPTAPHAEKNLPIQSNPFAPIEKANTSENHNTFARASSPPKRKHEGPPDSAPKRQVLEKSSSPDRVLPAPIQSAPATKEEVEEDDDDDDDESVHLNMELDDDDDDDEE
ncbi:rRNA processing/ribosome biogenesis-domain-containing protein [Fusarium flagelliforme]|uniref:Pre-rRNA-processing protein RIX1 n=1 Tax=Fusarium flagelliforme TaxID=2675880 RepID=A0A395MB54_9HYPO|nr:rRNA processing/ribosome biogenesis-domain-containing protein [Fusarium flagelliforme]KAH7188328.1 rRNA processing/ribosome biogenesis-domain-containing protein [Fusarium flagelliforme]RFN45056.1 pre-rrna-processing protein [Fusarium flagelliforme]